MLLGEIVLQGSYAATRDALWQVVRTCVANRELTGAAFPCLSVNVDQGAARGFAVLRPPIGKPDTILVPTRQSPGIEDPWLREPEAPNYFEAAWNARSFVAGATDDRVALAINSKLTRSQDQFHIHIGCLSPRLRLRLQSEAAAFAPGEWRALSRPIGFATVWALALPDADFSRVNPLRLVSETLPGAGEGDAMAGITLVVTPAKTIDHGAGFVVLAWRAGSSRVGDQMTAEDFLAPGCR